ncbi:hypothetical protein [Cohnella sp.]|uniref:hypothetical protein n=1 Tax=Cohnella sp. TaxID=1883426 RepID=UPI003568F7F8
MKKQDFQEVFLKISLHRICDLYLGKLEVALATLTKQQLWQPIAISNNSIGGMINHICEHIRMNEISLKNRKDTFTEDYVTFFPRSDTEPAEVITDLRTQITEWREVLSEYINDTRKLEFEDLHELYNLVEHTSYHLGQIIDRAQELTGKPFSFYKNGLNERFLRSKVDEYI